MIIIDLYNNIANGANITDGLDGRQQCICSNGVCLGDILLYVSGNIRFAEYPQHHVHTLNLGEL